MMVIAKNARNCIQNIKSYAPNHGRMMVMIREQIQIKIMNP
jgi:hypothetical protein